MCVVPSTFQRNAFVFPLLFVCDAFCRCSLTASFHTMQHNKILSEKQLYTHARKIRTYEMLSCLKKCINVRFCTFNVRFYTLYLKHLISRSRFRLRRSRSSGSLSSSKRRYNLIRRTHKILAPCHQLTRRLNIPRFYKRN